MPIDKLRRDYNDALLERIATAIERGALPLVEDSVVLEQLVWDYREYKGDVRDLGLRMRANSSGKPRAFTEIDQLVNSFVQQKECIHSVHFADRVRSYLRKVIPIAKLFGETSRPVKNDIITLGWIAELTHDQIRKADGKQLSTKSKNVSSSGSLYAFLTDVSSGLTNELLIHTHDLGAGTEIEGLRRLLKDEKVNIHISPETWKRYRSVYIGKPNKKNKIK